ncbi:MAG TPA: NADH-quinone oxidoreductase subunit L, partial [Solibacterales bacterium]|nr:NADH-quinone oxidoreductase subunit L [Bryobacterales bacterium]
HAFFKALLFLGAGSVIHAMSGEQDMRRMGGLRKYTPWTFLVLLCAAVAIAGVPPFAGFHSKDAILLAAHHKYPWMYWVGVITAGMTAFYVFRSIFMTFFGELRAKPAHGGHGHGHDDHGHHGTPHESPWVMLGPLVVLAVLSLGGGYLPVLHFLEPVLGGEHAPHEAFLVYTSVAAGVLGIALAYVLYVAAPALPGKIAGALGGLYRLVYDKYRVDEAYDAIVVHPIRDGSRSVLWKGFDLGLIDGIVNGVGGRARGIGGVLKLAQSGYVRSYAAWVVFGAVVAIAAIGFLASGGVR